MAEYIEREKAWRKVNRAKNIEEALKLIDSLPTADVVEVKQAEWIKISLGDFDFVKRYKCSLCENIVLPDTDIITYYRYCYNCGARMKWKGGAVNG